MYVTEREVEGWLREDVGLYDVAADLPGELSARLVATEPGVAAGVDAAAAVYEYLDATVERAVASGDRVDPGDTLVSAAGAAPAMLRAERVAATLLGRASGIATETWVAVEAATDEQRDVAIAATRRTTPGLRGLEKRAVVAGGGDPGRLDRSAVVVVGRPHVERLGLEDAVERFRGRTAAVTPLGVDVTTPEAGEAAAEAGADLVRFLDLPPEEVAVGVAAVPDGVHTAVVGDVSHGEVRAYARTGVDVIAMASLTAASPPLGVDVEYD